MKALGVVMAGGRNVRYGGKPKALAEVGGRRIVDRVIEALHTAASDVVIIANDVAAYEFLGLQVRGDEVASGAALAGLLTALHWCGELGCDGVITVACDMPFASAPLLQRLLEVAEAEGADVVAPESGGRRGIEPLCAFYSRNCHAAIESALARADLRMISFYDDVRRVDLPLHEVRGFGDPEVLFLNVNTPEDLQTAERIAREQQI